MRITDMRECISSLFKDKERVAHMPTKQVYAIFRKNFQSDGTPIPKNPTTNKKTRDNGEQLTIWDIPGAESWGTYDRKTNNINYL